MDISIDRIMISKTDAQGKITYCSPSFVEVTGFSEKELLGKSHATLRHSDMPEGLYQLLWQVLKQNKEFNGFICNQTKSGDMFWAFNNITPVHNINGKLTGYTCAKRTANPAAITLFSMYYEQMREEEQRIGGKAGVEQSAKLLVDILSATGDSYDASVFKLQLS